MTCLLEFGIRMKKNGNCLSRIIGKLLIAIASRYADFVEKSSEVPAAIEEEIAGRENQVWAELQKRIRLDEKRS